MFTVQFLAGAIVLPWRISALPHRASLMTLTCHQLAFLRNGIPSSDPTSSAMSLLFLYVHSLCYHSEMFDNGGTRNVAAISIYAYTYVAIKFSLG